MIHLLSIKDTPEYWFKKLLNELLVECNLQNQFIIIDNDDIISTDKYCITIETQSTYDKQSIKQNDAISDFKIVQIGIRAGVNIDQRQTDDYINIANQLNLTIFHYLAQRSHHAFNIYQLNRTSTSKRVGMDSNKNPIYNSRYEFRFFKTLERVPIKPGIPEKE
jgi:hypothetical protein